MAGAELMQKRILEYMEVKSGFGGPEQQERMLAREFKLFDRDASGEIDIEEFKKVRRRNTTLLERRGGLERTVCSRNIHTVTFTASHNILMAQMTNK